jgi:hypothetical protein
MRTRYGTKQIYTVESPRPLRQSKAKASASVQDAFFPMSFFLSILLSPFPSFFSHGLAISAACQPAEWP